MIDNLEGVLLKPIVSEKSWQLQDDGKYVFRVHPQANKPLIRRAVEQLFKVKAEKVWIVGMPSKPRRKKVYQKGQLAAYRKAIVQLAEGQRIEIFNR